MEDLVKHYLRRAADEIRVLRRENEVLRARDEAFQLVGRIVDAGRGGMIMPMSEDIVWQLEQAVFDAEARMRTQEEGRAEQQPEPGMHVPGGACGIQEPETEPEFHY
jgi:hypothetical protein